MYDMKALYQARAWQDAVASAWPIRRPRSSPAGPTCWCRCGRESGPGGAHLHLRLDELGA